MAVVTPSTLPIFGPQWFSTGFVSGWLGIQLATFGGPKHANQTGLSSPFGNVWKHYRQCCDMLWYSNGMQSYPFLLRVHSFSCRLNLSPQTPLALVPIMMISILPPNLYCEKWLKFRPSRIVPPPSPSPVSFTSSKSSMSAKASGVNMRSNFRLLTWVKLWKRETDVKETQRNHQTW